MSFEFYKRAIAVALAVALLRVPCGATLAPRPALPVPTQALMPSSLCFRLVISIGGRHIRVGVIHQGRLLLHPDSEEPIDTRLNKTDDYLRVLDQRIDETLDRLPLVVRWFGHLTDTLVGVPGILRDGFMIAIFNVVALQGVDLGKAIRSRLAIFGFRRAPVLVLNDLALEARAEQRHVQGRFLYFNAGTGLNAAVVDGPQIDGLEFGALPDPHWGTLEGRYQSLKATNDPREMVESFIDELVRVVAVSNVRHIVLAGGVVEEVPGFYLEVRRQLAERRLPDVRVSLAREPGNLRGLNAALVPIPASAPASPRAKALRDRYEVVQRFYEELWTPHRPAGSWFSRGRTGGEWMRHLTLWIIELGAMSVDMSTWSPEEQELAGLLTLRLRQATLHLQAELNRLSTIFQEKPKFHGVLRRIIGWEKPFPFLKARLFSIEDRVVHAFGRSSLSPLIDVWQNEFALAGVPHDRLSDFKINIYKNYANKEKTLLVDAWDIVRLIGIPAAGSSVHLRENNERFLRELRVLGPDDKPLFALKLYAMNNESVVMTVLVQKLVADVNGWVADVLAPLLEERGYQYLHVPHPHPTLHQLPGAVVQGTHYVGDPAVRINLGELVAERQAA